MFGGPVQVYGRESVVGQSETDPSVGSRPLLTRIKSGVTRALLAFQLVVATSPLSRSALAQHLAPPSDSARKDSASRRGIGCEMCLLPVIAATAVVALTIPASVAIGDHLLHRQRPDTLSFSDYHVSAYVT